MTTHISQVAEHEWVAFAGGELEGRRPKALCPSCRARLKQAASVGSGSVHTGTLCFECYRAEMARERAIRAAGALDTASEERFQSQLPFEPVNRARLEALKAERMAAVAAERKGVGQFADRRRQAQIAARHALQEIVAGVAARRLAPVDRESAIVSAIHAAELQLPESWLPFVVAR